MLIARNLMKQRRREYLPRMSVSKQKQPVSRQRPTDFPQKSQERKRNKIVWTQKQSERVILTSLSKQQRLQRQEQKMSTQNWREMY